MITQLPGQEQKLFADTFQDYRDGFNNSASVGTFLAIASSLDASGHIYKPELLGRVVDSRPSFPRAHDDFDPITFELLDAGF